MQTQTTPNLKGAIDSFSETELISVLKHYLPSQTPLKDFIHHNSLHAFQDMKFYDAVFKASKIFGFQPTLVLNDFRKLYQIGRIDEIILDKVIRERKGDDGVLKWKERVVRHEFDEHNEQRIGQLRSQWKKLFHIDLDNLVQPFLFRLLSSFLDQGISIWEFPIGNLGFLESIQEFLKNC